MTSPPYIESLPDDLLSEILVRLPDDVDLHDRARLVCRRWSHVVPSVDFANKHLHRSSYGLVLAGWDHNIYVSATKQGQIEVSRLGRKRMITSSSNGLVLEFHPLHISNPATKKTFLLPGLSCVVTRSQRCAVACGATSMEYKVVLLHIDPQRASSWYPAILTVGVDNSLRRLQVEHIPDNLSRLFDRGWVVTEGFVHWTWSSCGTVLSLDVETEIIKQTSVPLPATASVEEFCYLSTGRSLSLLFSRRDSMWEVWEMIPEAGEWRECTHFHVPCDQNGDSRYFWPLGWVKYPEVLACHIGCIGNLNFYNLRTREIDSTHASFQFVNAFPHRNTLLWLS